MIGFILSIIPLKYWAAIAYIFYLHLMGQGKETFSNTSQAKQYCFHLIGIIVILGILVYLENKDKLLLS